jgi:hypothetical protein
MSDYNIIMYIVEDDKNMSSALFHDLKGLVSKRNNIPINILYHSYYFFGDYRITIRGDKITFYKIAPVKREYDLLKNEMTEFYNKYSVRGKKNILVYGGHEIHIYIDGMRNTNSTFFEHIEGLTLLVLDSCYSSTVSMLSHLMNKTEYVIACQSASPYRGFIGSDFLKILKSKRYGRESKYKKIVKSFIERNNLKNKALVKCNYRTDGVLVEMKRYREVVSMLESSGLISELRRSRSARLEDVKNYNYYDLVELVRCNSGTGCRDVIKKIRKCVRYHRKNMLCKRFLRREGKVLNGISLWIE